MKHKKKIKKTESRWRIAQKKYSEEWEYKLQTE